MKLYEIDEALAECFDPETGEVTDLDAYENLQGERDKKIEGIACIIKNRQALINELKAEGKRVAERVSALEVQNKNTEAFLDSILNGKRFETGKVLCSYRKSTRVDITDMSKIPDEYMNVKTEYAPMKTAIKQALKDNKEVPGCALIETNNLSIK